MTLQQIQYYIALCRYLHFGDAARSCFISQPSLSQSIADLEKELNVTLLLRNSRSVQITPAGEAFLERILNVTQSVDDAIQAARRAQCGISGHLSIGMVGGLASSINFSNIIYQFKSTFPEVDVEVRFLNMKELKLRLLEQMIDIVLIRKYVDLDKMSWDKELGWFPISKDKFKLLVHKNHPLAALGHVDLADVSEEQFIFLSENDSPEMHKYTYGYCVKKGVLPNIAYGASSLEELCIMVKAGMGCAVVPECAKFYCGDSSVLLDIDDDMSYMEIGIAWLKKNGNPVIPSFIDEMQAKICFE